MIEQNARLINEGYDGNFLVSRAEGCTLWDQQGRQYYDMSMAAGTAILGHAHPVVQNAIRQAARSGTLYCRPTTLGQEYVDCLQGFMPWFTHFALCNTGSEAVARLVRIARALTKRTKIGVFAGDWHGSLDTLLVDGDGMGHTYLRSLGTPTDLLDQILLLPYDSPTAFELIRKHKDELAAVLIEPIQGALPRDDVGQFLHDLRVVTSECGVLLAFDEVLTGARLGIGGVQEKFKVHADLATYGKVFGGGLPIGIVAGTKTTMGFIREPSIRGRYEPGTVILGGTFSGNPLTLSVGLAVLKYIKAHACEIYSEINSHGNNLRNSVNGFCSERNLTARMYGVGSMCRLVMTAVPVKSAYERDLYEAPKDVQDQFYRELLNKGVHVAGNRLLLLSDAHSDLEIEVVTSKFIEALEQYEVSLP